MGWQPALDLLWRARFRWKFHPHQVTGDIKYATAKNITAIETQGIRAYVPVSAVGHDRSSCELRTSPTIRWMLSSAVRVRPR
jgi:hypothetical protein